MIIYIKKKTYDIIIHDIELKTNQSITKFNQHDLYIIDNLLTTNGIMNYTGFRRSLRNEIFCLIII